MLDIFKVNENEFLLNLPALYDFSEFYDSSIVLEFNKEVFTIFDFAKVDSNFFSFLSLNDMIELSAIKNNVDDLTKIFPSLEDDIELLDL
jgi:hypothetical protein